ncbi:hypothetical protein AG1IA_08335 [Rhizoctonia solani AG-1 IA]|uniref:Uncharacterized protein n=1 Tax=Thanatephorus cucumeris (strain AG1-IA) TaxID=983506 RepID=L8WLJ3_THACA|nr:hypothetical protein AG1IA_08335 [Rhizoctonia solani AG-1 IA]
MVSNARLSSPLYYCCGACCPPTAFLSVTTAFTHSHIALSSISSHPASCFATTIGENWLGAYRICPCCASLCCGAWWKCRVGAVECSTGTMSIT